MLLFVHVPPSIRGRHCVQTRQCALQPLARRNPTSAQSISAFRAGVRLCANPSSTGNATGDGEDKKQSTLTKPASGTFIGRIVVEILALIVGVTLLVFVAIWKCINVLTMYMWRLLIWLANVRRLGRWACGRAVVLGSAMTKSPGQIGVVLFAIWHKFATGVSALYRNFVTVFSSMFPVRGERHVTVRSARVLDDDELVSKKELDDVQREIRKMREMLEKNAAGGGREYGASHGTEVYERPTVDVAPNVEKRMSVNSIGKGKSRLILLRHAKSAWDRSGKLDDHERDLSPVGEKEAELVGRELTRRGWLYDGILCSNAKRTTQTLDLLSAASSDEPDEEHGKIVITESLYYAVSGDEMASAVDKEAPVGSLRPGTTTLVVCHSPGCEELVECLTGEKPEMGTACAALLEFPRENVEHNPEQSGGNAETLQLTYGRKEWSLVGVIRPAALQ